MQPHRGRERTRVTSASTSCPSAAVSVLFAFCILHFAFRRSRGAQQLLDRILARVSGNELTLTDLQTARGFGVVTGPTEAAALEQLIDRQLLLIEVARFPPPDPPEAAVAAEARPREGEWPVPRLQELMAVDRD